MSKFSTQRTVVFAAMSKENFYLREHIIKHILDLGHTPTCAFMMFSYYLLGTVDRKGLIEANNDLIRRSDELWVFGNISSGVRAEIDLALQLGMPVKYFLLAKLPDSIKFQESDPGSLSVRSPESPNANVDR